MMSVVAEPVGGATPAVDDDVVTVSFGVDERFVPHMAAVIASVLDHAPGAKFRFLILHPGVDAERKALVESVAPGARFDWIEVGDKDVPEFMTVGHFTRAILFRLGLERLAPADCRRVIYLDSDVIVVRDLRELWRMDLGGRPIGAVSDTFAYLAHYPSDFAKRFALDFAAGSYVNSGVLLIDLERVRQERGFTRAIEFIAANSGQLNFADQDAINAVFWGRIKDIGNEWNASRDRCLDGVIPDIAEDKRLNGRPPAVIHYSDKYKPWMNNGYHPWTWLYWRYLARTPFFAEVEKAYGVTRVARAKLWVRWLLRRPRLIGSPLG